MIDAYEQRKDASDEIRDCDRVPPSGICPRCGEDDIDQLIWDDDRETVTCQRCGTNYTVHRVS